MVPRLLCAGGMRSLAFALVAASAGCRLYTGNGTIDGGDAPPTQLVINGVVTANGGSATPVANAMVSALHLDDDSLAASTVTAADGTFSLTLLLGDNDVYLDAKGTDSVDTYYNFQTVASDSAYAAIDLFTPAAYAQLFTAAGVAQVPGTGVLEVDAAGAATVSIEPPSGMVSYAQYGPSYILSASTGTVDAWYNSLGDAYSREVRVFSGDVSQVALPAPPGAD
jgi:hypothetical protein